MVLSNPESPTDTCPHCGRELSPWERVLLSVDRALMCKGCWYRIILDPFDTGSQEPRKDQTENERK